MQARFGLLAFAGLGFCAVNFAAAQAHSRAHSARPQPAITIVDQAGRIAPESPASPNGQTVDVSVGPNFSFSFSPDSVTIVTGDTVKWTWASSGHNVRSGTPCSGDGSFCSPADTNCTANPTSNTNATYSHTFNQPGTYSYFCSVHCGSGMTGTVNVVAPFVNITSVVHDASGLTITGQTVANATITIEAAPNLATMFTGLGPATANNTGTFTFTDPAETLPPMRFYRATYP